MDDPFYTQFEARFRGSRTEIKKRQSVYLPLLASLREVFPDGSLLDLGCGRCEWLELASEAGWQAIGVDTDAGMLAHAAALGLNVQQAEALDYLRALPEASSAIVTSFHVVEHFPFAVLQDFIRETHRVLQPGGVLILETPNPENIFVGTCSFYVDPTHRTPLPPELLHFLVQNCGFINCRIVRLNEFPIGTPPTDFSMVRVLYGVSPDFAVIAQKRADPSLTPALQWPPASLGCSLMEMAVSFDRGLHLQIEEMQSTLTPLITRFEEFKVFQQELHTSYVRRIEEIEVSRQELQAAHASRVEELQAVYASRSWQYMAPYRWMGRRVKATGMGVTKICSGAVLLTKKYLSGLLKGLMIWVYCCPRLKDKALWLLHKIPRLKGRLKRCLREDNLPKNSSKKKPNVSEGDFSPQTVKILADIQHEQNQQKERKEAAAVPQKDK
jgi:O-antigen chain-terminating methyltransferase